MLSYFSQVLRAQSQILEAAASALETDAPHESTDALVGVDQFEAFHFASRPAFGAFLRALPKSFRAGAKRVAYKRDVLEALEKRGRYAAAIDGGSQ